MNSIRNKTLLILLASTGLFLAITGVAGFGVLWRGFLRLEQQEMSKESDRIHKKFESEMKSTVVKLTDWAAWDDMYEYVQTKSKKFEQSNLVEYSTLKNLEHNVMIVTDGSGNVIKYLENLPDSSTQKSLKQIFFNAITLNKSFYLHYFHPTTESTSGFFNDGKSVWILAARRITKTDGSGLPKGTLILGRQITPSLVEHWSRDLQMDFKISDESPDVISKSETTQEDDTRLVVNDYDHISLLTPFRDYMGQYSFSIYATFKRDLMAQGRFTILIMGGIITLGTILLVVSVMWLLRSLILNRLSLLSEQTIRVGKSTAGQAKISISGSDEISVVADSINKMLEVIDDRTNQIKDIVKHVNFGMFITDIQGLVLRGHTRSCTDLLGLGISGLPVTKVFQLNKDQELLFEILFDQLREDIVPPEVTLNQIPKRIQQNGKYIAISASPIRDAEGKITRVLFSLVDVTSEADTERENDENKTLVSIFRARSGFSHLIRHTKSEFSEIATLLKEPGQTRARMKLHTLNGNLKTFGLKVLSQLVSDVENRKEIAPADLKKIELTIRAWVSKFETVTGVKWEQSSSKSVHEVSDVSLSQFENDLINSEVTPEPIKNYIKSYSAYTRAKKLGEIFAPHIGLTSDIAKKLRKKAVLVIQGGDIKANAENIQPLVDAIPHLIRNALDHGIEPLQERLALKKQDVATLYISVECLEDQTLKISFSDDGRGIYPDKIAEAAVRKGLISQQEVDQLSNKQKMNLILLPGFTSTSEISDISGRGIGLAAVKELIEENLKGKFSLDSEPGSGTKICMHIPVKSVEAPQLQAKTPKHPSAA
jgi:chemotaxis protein histidine kinase CheA